MPNAHVFVGGRVDQADRAEAIAQRVRGLDDVRAQRVLGLTGSWARAHYVAAAREAFEESGLLLAEDRGGREVADPEVLSSARAELNAGRLTFAQLLEEHDLYLTLGKLGYLARWLTPPGEVKRYDTHFFICEAPAGQQASFDRLETSAGSWYTARQALMAHGQEELDIAPPTFCVLEDLAGAASVDAALALAADRPREGIVPRWLPASDPRVLLMPDDCRFEDPGQGGSGTLHYLTLHGRHWERTRSP